MPLIPWKESYALGVSSVDAEHRAMIHLINEIYERLEGSTDSHVIEANLGEIHAGIAAHFALEERLMREAGWREFAEHKQDHEELLENIRDLMDGFAEDPERGAERLRRELADWFTGHFATFDARLHEAFPRHSHPH